MRQVAKKPLPPDEIVVKGGVVVSLQEWCSWNGSHEIVLDARKEGDEYTVFPYDPEHGGTKPQRGTTMAEAAGKAMHPDIAAKLAELFELKNPTEEQIRDLHSRRSDGLKVTFQ